jgi:hypothetical protein
MDDLLNSFPIGSRVEFDDPVDASQRWRGEVVGAPENLITGKPRLEIRLESGRITYAGADANITGLPLLNQDEQEALSKSRRSRGVSNQTPMPMPLKAGQFAGAFGGAKPSKAPSAAAPAPTPQPAPKQLDVAQALKSTKYPILQSTPFRPPPILPLPKPAQASPVVNPQPAPGQPPAPVVNPTPAPPRPKPLMEIWRQQAEQRFQQTASPIDLLKLHIGNWIAPPAPKRKSPISATAGNASLLSPVPVRPEAPFGPGAAGGFSMAGGAGNGQIFQKLADKMEDLVESVDKLTETIKKQNQEPGPNKDGSFVPSLGPQAIRAPVPSVPRTIQPFRLGGQNPGLPGALRAMVD